ncbi:MAG: hypothetical protein KAI47_05950 [Deltaproteobacteria bacterium]|nr:hypothetical protein [Deltaproteobacteria bacterium]
MNSPSTSPFISFFKRLGVPLLGVLAFLTLGGADSCNPSLNQDPGFDLWCGNSLCAWKTEAGKIQRVPTWHRSDYGVSLVGDRVVLSQSFSATSKDTTCFHVTLQADSDPGVDLELSFDFFDDGRTDYVHPLISDHFTEVTYDLKAPTYFDGVRLRIVKRGSGKAILARIRIERGSDCQGTPLDSGPRPAGVICENALQCASQRCVKTLQTRGSKTSENPWGQGPTWRTTCATCETDTDCDPSKVCGQSSPSQETSMSSRSWYRACVTKGSKALADRCAIDSECETGVCCLGICSTCCVDSSEHAAVSCPNAGQCKQRFPTCADVVSCDSLSGEDEKALFEIHLSAWQCDPDQHLGAAQADCLRAADCQSRACVGESPMSQCLISGHACQEDNDCGQGLFTVCLSIGQRRGRCQ